MPYLTPIPTEQGAGSPTGGGNLQAMIQALQNSQVKPQQQQQQPMGVMGGFGNALSNMSKQPQNPNSTQGALFNPFSPGNQASPMDSYINSSGDLMSNGMVTPG
jgi:hypothetical protein